MTTVTTTTIIIKNKGTDKKQRLGSAAASWGGCVFKLNGTQLVFLQVPGFKELQAFLHSQAFLQTLGGHESRRKKKQTVNTGPSAPRAGCSQAEVRVPGRRAGWEGLLERLVGHAKERDVPCETVLSG